MKLRLNLLTTSLIGFSLLMSAVAENAPNKNSVVVIKCRGQVYFQSGSENKESTSSSLTKVQTLKSFAGIGSFVVEPNSEVTFFDFRTGDRVTVKLPANAKELRLSVGKGPVKSPSPAVVIKPSQELVALSSKGLDFQESMGAASTKILISSPRQRASSEAAPRSSGNQKPPGGGPKAGGGGSDKSAPAPASAPAMVQQSKPEPTPPLEQLVTVNANPSFRLTDKQLKSLGEGKFYWRISDDVERPWTPCAATVYGVGKSTLFKLGQKMSPGEVFELVRSEKPPLITAKPTLLVGRYQQETIDALNHQRENAKGLDQRLEYLTGLVSLKLFDEASHELDKLARQYPAAQDWDQMSKDFQAMR